VDIFEQALLQFRNGEHKDIVELLSNQSVYDPYDLRMDYSIGLSTVLMQDSLNGLNVLDALVKKCRGICRQENVSPEILHFMMLVSMQTALIADFFLESDRYLFSDIAFTALNEAHEYAKTLGNNPFDHEISKIKERFIFFRDKKPLLINATPSVLQIETTNIVTLNAECVHVPR